MRTIYCSIRRQQKIKRHSIDWDTEIVGDGWLVIMHVCVLEIERQQDEVNKHTTHTNSHPQTPLDIKLGMQFKLKIFVKFHFAWNMFVICLLEELCFASALRFVVHVLILFGLYLKCRLRNMREENVKEKIWLLLFILICRLYLC